MSLPSTGGAVFVLGLHEHHRPRLQRIASERGLEVRPLLSFADVRRASRYDIEALLDACRRELDAADVRAAAICTYWDFPSSCLVPILCAERGLPSASLRSVVTFEHKLWSRIVQAEVAPKETPAFEAVDPWAEPNVSLDHPYFLKPVKSYSSHLGFRIRNDADLEQALSVLRDRIGRLGKPFQQVVERVDDVPDAVRDVPGTFAIAEEIIDGRQCTLEGHVHGGEVAVHGIFDIHRWPNGSTFSHYTYPSRLPEHVTERMRRVAAELMAAAGYDQASFNIELFWDEDADRTWILEVNTRISQEHSDLMAWVDDTTNLEVMVDTALGRRPALEPREGPCGAAAKFFHRSVDDGIVRRVPTDEELRKVETQHAPCHVSVEVETGDRLSELEDQESYSYELAYVYVGRGRHEHLEAAYADIVGSLPLQVDTAPS